MVVVVIFVFGWGVCVCLFVRCMCVVSVKHCMLLHGVLFVMVSVVCVVVKQRLCAVVWCSVACCLQIL